MARVIATTERLLLREWSEDDTDPFMRLAADPDVMEFINSGVPMERDRVVEFIARQLELAAGRGWCRWALESRAEPGTPIGFCGPGCTFAPDIEVGWWIRRDLWGRGLATEAARAAVEVCFSVVGFPRVISVIHPGNTRSQRVATKLGMRYEGDFAYRDLTVQRWALDNPGSVPPDDGRYRRDCG